MISVFSIALTLFLLMDPLGNIPIYITILESLPPRRRLMITLREMGIALIIIFIFAWAGNDFLSALGLCHESIFLAGGIVLFVMSLKMLFPENGTLLNALAINGEPLIFPLAIPLVAGPSVLAAVMIYSNQLDHPGSLFIAIVIAWIVSTIILLASTYLQKWLGARGIKALERLMGLILMLITINMFLDGVVLFQTSEKTPTHIHCK